MFGSASRRGFGLGRRLLGGLGCGGLGGERLRLAGALGCSLSGSGPSIFALTRSLDAAHVVGGEMREAFAAASGVAADLWVSLVGRTGARIVDLAEVR